MPNSPSHDDFDDDDVSRLYGDSSQSENGASPAMRKPGQSNQAAVNGSHVQNGVRSEPNGRDFAPAAAGYRGDYRDYRGLDYRSAMDYRDNGPIAGNESQIDWASALWRYRFALILPALLGLGLGGAYFTTRPNVFRSTARLIVESDRPWTPDGSTKEVVSSVPPSELLLMQLRSEQVLEFAARHPLMADAAAQSSIADLRGVLSGGVEFQNAMSGQSDRALAFFLHFNSSDPQFAVNAVTALSDGLQNFFAEKSESSVAELKKLITTAKDKLLPELTTLEAEYRKFRENSELVSDQNGIMINPYREKQLALQSRRLSLEDEQRDLSTKMSAITHTITSTQDPLIVMEVVQQLLGEEMYAVRQLVTAEDKVPTRNSTYRDEDLSLAKLAIERTLLPLEVERQQFASQFGTGHPAVRQFDLQIAATREKLNELTAQETKRMSEIRKEGESPSDELIKIRRERAELAVSGFMKALETRRTVLDSQVTQLDDQITKLSDQATKLARAESENAMYLRRIDRSQKLFDSVEEQMTKINLSDQDASIHVSQLNAPSPPFLVSPILSKFLMMGGLIGAMAGLGLVYLFESQSKTYRSSDEISAALGLRVLSHVPTDSLKLPKPVKGEQYPYADIDPSISLVHRPRSTTSESIRRLRTSVFFESNSVGAKVIQVTSPIPEDGKSTLAANLAVSIARSGKRVVIVDADMRRPQMTASFSMEDRQGLTQLIDGTCEPLEVIHETAVENLSIVPCGPIPSNPAEALSMHQFKEFMSWLRERYDFVIVDTPPLLVVADPAIVASAVDGVVYTFRVRRGCRPQTKEGVAMLRATGTPIFGCVVNRVDQNTSATGYKSYQSASYYSRRYSSYSSKNRTESDKQRPRDFVISPKSVGSAATDNVSTS